MCSRNNKNSYSAYEGYGMNAGNRDGYGNITEAYGNFPQNRDYNMMQGGGYGGSKMRSNYGGIKGGFSRGNTMGTGGGSISSITRNMVDNNGTLKNVFGTPYTFVMVKSANCMYCQTATPDFQLLANMMAGDPRVTMATVQADEERDLYMLLSKLFGLQGVPAYFLFKNGRKVAEYQGDRTQRDMSSWLTKYVQ